MVRRIALLVLAALVPLALPTGVAHSSCTSNQILLNECPTVTGDIVDGGVQLGGDVTVPGRNSGGNGAGNGAANNGGNSGANNRGNPNAVVPPVAWPGGVVRDGYTVTGPVTLSDLVGFRPAPGADQMEPDGWMIVGLDTNFYARADVQVQNGLLLGEPASVRFTPVRYRWTYGDGTTASRSTPGATWRALGLNEFDPTPTSHVYSAPGTYYIDLTIDFAAEYQWAAGAWTGIAGTIPVPANRLVATAGGAKTVLVERECTLNPAGPGC